MATLLLLAVALQVFAVTGQSVVEMSQHDWKKGDPSKRTESVKTFSFASYYASHMVLQRAPRQAVIWGYSPNIGDEVFLKVSSGAKYMTPVVMDPIHHYGVWKFTLNPESRAGPFTITATSGNETLQLTDVMFGDVWICSGQSNMQFVVKMGYNASQEIADAKNYPDVRLFTVKDVDSATPVPDLLSVLEPWSRGSEAAVDGSAYFSAVCWFFGRELYKKLGYPIGLIDSSWGGTRVETWSSPDALAKCGLDQQYHENTDTEDDIEDVNDVMYIPTKPSSIWNSMINPLLNMTIYGVIWYQGESNTIYNMNKYNCTFPAMIDDWRVKFSAMGQTDPVFPFGFVQLGPKDPDSTSYGYPTIRWHQTADYGYAPNPRMQNVFMAVAVDLSDFASPYGGVHIRDKQDVAARLVLSALKVAYKQDILCDGPLPARIEEWPTNITVTYTSNITYNNYDGFEALCPVNASKKTFWLPIPILMPLRPDSIRLWSGACGQGMEVLGLRYNWKESPCAFKTCTVYSAANPLLPGPPFIIFKNMTRTVGNMHYINWNSPLHIHV